MPAARSLFVAVYRPRKITRDPSLGKDLDAAISSKPLNALSCFRGSRFA